MRALAVYLCVKCQRIQLSFNLLKWRLALLFHLSNRNLPVFIHVMRYNRSFWLVNSADLGRDDQVFLNQNVAGRLQILVIGAPAATFFLQYRKRI